MTESDGSQSGWIEPMSSNLRVESTASRRTFLRRSAAAGAGTLALSVAGSNAALAHEIDSEDTNDVDVLNFALILYYMVDPDLSLWDSTQMPAVVWSVPMAFHVPQAIGLGFRVWD